MLTNCINEVKGQVHHGLHNKIEKQVDLHFGTKINLKSFVVIAHFINVSNLVDLQLRQEANFVRYIRT